MQAEIHQRITAFRTCLVEHGAHRTLEDHILRHDVSIVGEVEQRLRQAAADQYAVNVQGVYLVGSGKLGFSPKPGQWFKHFHDGSDLDLAIISPTLYAQVWSEVNNMANAGEFFNVDKFAHYHRMGWIRPDKLPAKGEYPMCRQWWDFFKRLSKREGVRIKVNAGLYYDTSFLRSYQSIGLAQLQQLIIGGKA